MSTRLVMLLAFGVWSAHAEAIVVHTASARSVVSLNGGLCPVFPCPNDALDRYFVVDNDLGQTIGVGSSDPDPAIARAYAVGRVLRPAGGNNVGEAEANASAELGSLAVDILGSVDAYGPGGNLGTEARNYVVADAMARWQDTAIVSLAHHPNQTDPLRIDTHATISGSAAIARFDNGARFEVGHVFHENGLYLQIVGSDQYASYRQIGRWGGTIDVIPPSDVAYSYLIYPGQPFTVDISFRLNFTEEVWAFRGTSASLFYADYGHTLLWGGITSVSNAITGEVLNDWVITSESGFDYSRPATPRAVPDPVSVPEPASVALVGLGLAALAASRKRKTQQP